MLLMEGDTEKIILEILKPTAPKKGIALMYLLEMTGTEEGCIYIAQKSQLLEAMLSMMFDDNSAIREDAQKGVINLTAVEKVVFIMLELQSTLRDITFKLLKECLDTQSKNLCCILTNLTRVTEGATFVADLMLDSQTVGLRQFVDALCSLHANKKDSLSILSLLLMNLTQVPRVRRSLMESPSYLLLQLLPIISFSQHLSSCKGVVGTIKNCCFEYDFHRWLLSEEVDLLPRILLPLAGPEEFDEDDMERLPPDLQYLPDTKQRESDPEVRGMLIQTVHKLCSTKAGRLYVREKNAYIIFRELHKWETCEDNEQSLLKVIDILIADEPQQGMENLHKVQIPTELEQKFLQEEQEAAT